MFQWGRFGPYVRPDFPTDDLVARSYEFSPLYNPAARIATRNAHHLRCWYNVGARWHDDINRWIVEEVVLPANRCDP